MVEIILRKVKKNGEYKIMLCVKGYSTLYISSLKELEHITQYHINEKLWGYGFDSKISIEINTYFSNTSFCYDYHDYESRERYRNHLARTFSECCAEENW